MSLMAFIKLIVRLSSGAFIACIDHNLNQDNLTAQKANNPTGQQCLLYAFFTFFLKSNQY
jgi:hypothetical protein